MPFLGDILPILGGFRGKFCLLGGHFSPGPRQNKDSPLSDLGKIRISWKNIYPCTYPDLTTTCCNNCNNNWSTIKYYNYFSTETLCSTRERWKITPEGFCSRLQSEVGLPSLLSSYLLSLSFLQLFIVSQVLQTVLSTGIWDLAARWKLN